MCSVDAYYKENLPRPNDASSVGGRPMPNISYK